MKLGLVQCIYQGVCEILTKMADVFFSSSWRILELHSCSGISLATTTAIPGRSVASLGMLMPT
jgi:hypothetical protein